MARFLEALRQAEGSHGRPAPTVPSPRAYHPEVEPAPPGEPEGEVPFIEVGEIRSTSGPLASSRRAVAVAAEKDRTPSTVARPHYLHVTFQPGPGPERLIRPDRFVPELVAYHDPNHPVSAEYRVLLAGLQAQIPAEHPHVLLFTSALPRAGTTTVLLNLAVTRARQGHTRVVLVDAHLRRPAVAERLGLPSFPGLRDVLAGSVALERVVRETGQAGLCAVPAGEAIDSQDALLAGDGMRAILRHLRERFDWVLVDAPSWGGHPEVLALSAACDAVYLVLPQDQAEATDVQELVEELPRQGVCLRGRILTR